MWKAAVAAARKEGVDIVADSARSIAGGSINDAWRVNSDIGPLFVKFNDSAMHEMFAAEAAGLQELAQTNSIRVPRVICSGCDNSWSFLILEYIAFDRSDNEAGRLLGLQLAQLHGCHSEAFGWFRDNTIGSTPQINTQTDDWIEFFGQHRLGFQLELASRRGGARLAKSGAQLCEQLDRFFAGITIEPALLHGDLWGGNWGVCKGQPVIFDPAVYYGDSETDIAMTTLFGGFPQSFYTTYREELPDKPGGRQRRELYRLYHVLNHYNLFGGGYGAQAERMIGALLAD
ncbi:MAG: fructosamine kinase family protein [Gammaproteobacteria bacterium]|nr:fructosamine kinase family protein [Gammaproteobacteria bacterium]